MSKFYYCTHELPCYVCHKQNAETELGWLTTEMKDDVVNQINEMLQFPEIDYQIDWTVQVTCNEQEAPEYLLLNYYGYSEQEIEQSHIESEDLAEINDQVSGHLLSDNTVKFAHEIALQSCGNCSSGDHENSDF